MIIMWKKHFRYLFFVANFYENCPFLGLYPKLSLSDRDILDCLHTVGVIWGGSTQGGGVEGGTLEATGNAQKHHRRLFNWKTT
jgi:hypothetical protein